MNMRSRKWMFGATATATLVLSAVVAWHCLAAWRLPNESAAVNRQPRIRPDYSRLVIPPNIAPLNFLVEEPASEYRVRISGTAGEAIVIGSRTPSIIIPPRPWRELLGQNRGQHISVEVYAKGADGRWSRFETFTNDVAPEEIDSHLAYRLLGPVCREYRDMGIYQRNIESYDESPILTSETVGVCMNCHTFQNNRPDLFSIQVRPGRDPYEAGMILVRNGHAERLNTRSKATRHPPGYTSWNPKAPIAAFAMIHPRQYFRGVGPDVREVFDSDADLAAFNVQTGKVSASPDIAKPAQLETFPGWSADGKTLYYSSAEASWGNDKLSKVEAIKVKYDLMAVAYDADKAAWGQPETLLSAAETGMSISEPKASPDGRYLLFCMADYGTFPVHRASSDLYLMDIETRKYRRLECNSQQSESWHCWSSNSRWIVFSSKRDNGLLARPYFCYIDAQGREHKPFPLPQRDPAFYDTYLKTYNVPELISGPVTVPQEELSRAVRSAIAKPAGSQEPKPAKEDSYHRN